MEPTISQLFDLASNRADTWYDIWNLFIVVSSAIVGYVAGKSVPLDIRSVVLLVLGFLVFAFGNFNSLSELREQRYHLCQQLLEDLKEAKILGAEEHKLDESNQEDSKLSHLEIATIHMKPPTEKWLIIFHFILDLIVVLAIVFISTSRRQVRVDEAGTVDSPSST